MVKNMAFKVIDRLFVVAYGDMSPTLEEWVRYLHEVERHGIDRTMHLIVTEGGGPNATQRRHLDELLAGRSVPVAVMSGSPAIRGMVTALSWFNGKIRAFYPAGLRDAIAYLEIGLARTAESAPKVLKLARWPPLGSSRPARRPRCRRASYRPPLGSSRRGSCAEFHRDGAAVDASRETVIVQADERILIMRRRDDVA